MNTQTMLLRNLKTRKDRNSIIDIINNIDKLSGNLDDNLVIILEFIDECYNESNTIVESDLKHILSAIKNKIIDKYTDKDKLIFINKKCKEYNKDGNYDDTRLVAYNSFLLELQNYCVHRIKEFTIKENHEVLIADEKIREAFNIKLIDSNDLLDLIYELTSIINDKYKNKIPENSVAGVCVDNIKYMINPVTLNYNKELILPSILNILSTNKNMNISDLINIAKSSIMYSDKEKKRAIDTIEKVEEPLIDENVLSIKNIKNKYMIREEAASNHILTYIIKSFKNEEEAKEIIKSINNMINISNVQDLTDKEFLIIFFNTFRNFIVHGEGMLVNGGDFNIINMLIDSLIVDKNIESDQAKTVVNVLEREINATKDMIYELKSDKYVVRLKEYLDIIENQYNRLNEYINNTDLNKEVIEGYNNTNLIRELAIIYMVEDCLSKNIVIENTAITLLRTAREKLKKKMEQLSAKEKQISRNIDMYVEKMERDITSALTIKERERVIKGNILPSASKTIKLGIATGTAWAVAPTIAVIGSIGALAISKKANTRERQLVLDEIEVHLKVVEKNIQYAESEGDLEILEELLKIENKLKREKQRIKYRMKVYYKQEV